MSWIFERGVERSERKQIATNSDGCIHQLRQAVETVQRHAASLRKAANYELPSCFPHGLNLSLDYRLQNAISSMRYPLKLSKTSAVLKASSKGTIKLF
jgi:hypothetical protein